MLAPFFWTFFREKLQFARRHVNSASENHRHSWIDEVRFHSREFLSPLFMFVFKWREFFFKRHPYFYVHRTVSSHFSDESGTQTPTEKWVEHKFNKIFLDFPVNLFCGPENLKKSRPKKLVKSISRKIFLTKIHFLRFQKWPKSIFELEKN